MNRQSDEQRIDWRDLATRLGAISWTENGRTESGGTAIAQRALCEIIGEEQLIAAVDYYVTGQPGFETAQSVLRQLRPPSAMRRCHEIFATAEDMQTRSDAIFLLSQICDRRVLNWVPAYLSDKDAGIKVWGLRILDQLLIMQGDIEEDEARPFIDAALADPDERVRKSAQQLVEMIEHDQACRDRMGSTDE